MANRKANMWAEQGNRQETGEERTTGKVVISSGCEVPVCFQHTCSFFFHQSTSRSVGEELGFRQVYQRASDVDRVGLILLIIAFQLAFGM